jgi:hypothetical protein
MGHRDRVVLVGVCVAFAVFAGRPPFAVAQTGGGAGSALRGLLAESSGFREGENEALRGLFQAQTTTFPIGSSAGGFTWSFDSSLGVPTRRSRSFGPMFAERALTTGHMRLNVSLAFQRTEWKSVAGFKLSEGLVFVVNDFSEDERIEQRSIIRLTTEQALFNATFGVTDRIDVGVIVPYVRQDVSGELRQVCTSFFSSQVFCDVTSPRSGTSAGIGDVTIRGKYSLPVNVVSLAATIDMRLPTGDERNLLGAGQTQTTASLAGGLIEGTFLPHFNVGYMFGGKGILEPVPGGFGLDQGDFSPSSEFKYTVGSEFVVSTRMTISADIIGRAMLLAPVPYLRVTTGSRSVTSGPSIARGTLNLLLGAVSAKVMFANSWLLTGAVAFPLNSNGLRPGITPVIGFERAF